MVKPAYNKIKIKHQERLLFTKHLHTMIKAGIPLVEGLDTLVKQTKTQGFKKVLIAITKDIENGKSLAKSISAYPKIFDELYISLIDVGEESGTLEDSLAFLSEHLEKDYQLRRKIVSAMFYPALVMGMAFVMGIFIMVFILPRLVEFFSSFEIELPITTKILLNIAKFSQLYGALLVVAFFVLIVGIRLLLINKKARKIWHILLIKVPLFGNLLSFAQAARLSRNLGTLIKTGVPISKSIEITANTLSNLKYKQDLEEISESLKKGKSIGESMENDRYWEYPPIMSKMITVGEKTGKLDETLLYLADFYEEEIDNISKNLTTIIEPILLICVAFVVGFIALAIISPIYELTGSIRN